MGQGAWFTHFHPEKLESARLRYVNETKRIIGVLNRALEGREYLVGDKYTIADLGKLTVLRNCKWDFLSSPFKSSIL